MNGGDINSGGTGRKRRGKKDGEARERERERWEISLIEGKG